MGMAEYYDTLDGYLLMILIVGEYFMLYIC